MVTINQLMDMFFYSHIEAKCICNIDSRNAKYIL